MADLTIKPQAGSSNKVIIQDQGGRVMLQTEQQGLTLTSHLVSSSDPTVSSNPVSGVGTKWINSSTGVEFICVDATAGANIWKHTGMGTSIPNFTVEYLVIAGGGSGAGRHYNGGGGAGGYRCSYASEESGGKMPTEDTWTAALSTTYMVKVGAGGASAGNHVSGYRGIDSYLKCQQTDVNNTPDIICVGGGPGQGDNWGNGDVQAVGQYGGSSGGARGNDHIYMQQIAHPIQGSFSGLAPVSDSSGWHGAPGGGGAGGKGQNRAEADVHGGHGGLGIESSITGVATWRGGGGGGGAWQGSEGGCGGNRGGQWNVSQATKAGGGDGTGLNTEPTTSGTNGKVNTGGGGGGVSGYATPFNSGPGGSGVVIIRYPNTRTVSSVSGGLTTSTLNGTHSSSKYTVFSAGTGTFVFT